MDEFIGRKIEQFLIETYVGQGKTGLVYQACDLNLGRAIAIKMVRPEITAVPAMQKQLSQATRAISSLSHPSIVTLYSTGFQHGRVYIVTDYVNGMSLGNALSRLKKHRQSMPLNEAVYIAAQLADALSTAHQAGRRHLNLKPENIILKRRQRARPGDSAIRPMLTDFGLALIPETGLTTAVADLQSNLPYFAPEQCRPDHVDGRADIYSLGMILYQLLAGHAPFTPQTAVEAQQCHLQALVPPLEAIRPDISPALCHIVHTAVAKEPNERYQLAEQMADDLRQLLQPKPQSKAKPTAVARTVTAPTATANHAPSTDEMLTDVHVMDIPERATRLLIVRQGAQPRQVRLNKPRILIGRAKDSDIVLNQRHVSRRHALLEWVNGRWRLLDLGSSGGVFIDGRRLSAHLPETWAVGQLLQIGNYFLHWAAPDLPLPNGRRQEEPPTEQWLFSPTASQQPSSHGRFALSLDPGLVSLPPGQQLPLQIGLFNQSGRPLAVKLAVRGLPGVTYKLLQDSLALMPGGQATVLLLLQCPLVTTQPMEAGDHPFEVVAQTDGPEPETAVVAGVLSIEPVERFSFAAAGSINELSDGAKLAFVLRNQGNVPLTYEVAAQDEGDWLEFALQPTSGLLRPGQRAIVTGQLLLGKRPWLGQTRLHPFLIEGRAAENLVKQAAGTARLRPWLSTRLLLVLLLICLLVWLATAVVF